MEKSSKTYYHATRWTNLISIISDGVIYPGADGVVYMTETPEDAVKFVALRVPRGESVFVIELKDLEEDKVVETFDHSPVFFKCRAFGYPEDIEFKHIASMLKYL